MHTYAVCYDLSDDKRRTRIAKTLLEYGERVQYSVFEISVKNPQQLETLKQRLRTIAEGAEDPVDIRFYRLCQDCRRASSTLDEQPVMQMPAVVIL